MEQVCGMIIVIGGGDRNANILMYPNNIHNDKPLIYVIRDDFGLTGTKLGCGLEQCGSCAVIIDGEKKLSCNLLAIECEKKEIDKIMKVQSKLIVNRSAFKTNNKKIQTIMDEIKLSVK